MRTTFRRVVSGIVLSTLLTGCGSWKVQRVSPEQVVTEQRPKRLRVTRTDSSRVVVARPVVEGDAIAGHALRGRRITADTVRVPLQSVAYVATPKTPIAAWVVAGLGIAITAGLLSLALSMPSSIP